MTARSLKIEIVGGGPSGLYAALLAKKRNPNWNIHVTEQNPPTATYGFGVTLADRALTRLEAADRPSFEKITSAMKRITSQVVDNQGTPVRIVSAGAAGSIERLTLLRILYDECHNAGIEISFGQRLADAASLNADVIIVSDGANSATRNPALFGTTTHLLGNRFAWYGTRHVTDAATLAFRKSTHGFFVGHYYKYTEEMSTFVAECDAATWEDGGFGAMSDDQRRAVIETVFADDLQGAPLIDNRSIWRQFAVVRNEHWSSGKMVLLGDALRSMHFSIGSGTRLAMEDSIALVDALCDCPTDIPQAFLNFRSVRQSGMEKLVDASERSFMWYEDFAEHMQLPPVAFAHSYMTRTGRMDDARLRAASPEFMAMYDNWREGAAA